MEKDPMTAGAGKRMRRPRRWTLLLVDDQGRTLPVRGFRILLAAGAALLVLAVAAGAVSLLSYRQTLAGHRGLAVQVEELRGQVERLRRDKERMMVQLALLEQRENPSAPSGAGPEPDADPGAPEPSAAAAAPPVSETAQAPSPVEVEDFSYSWSGPGDRFSVAFIVRKSTEDEASISGYGFVLLGSEAEADRWLVLPRADLERGEPRPVKRGQYFSISRFKSMHFASRVPESAGGFRFARVLIYSPDGDLLVKKNFPLDRTDRG